MHGSILMYYILLVGDCDRNRNRGGMFLRPWFSLTPMWSRLRHVPSEIDDLYIFRLQVAKSIACPMAGKNGLEADLNCVVSRPTMQTLYSTGICLVSSAPLPICAHHSLPHELPDSKSICAVAACSAGLIELPAATSLVLWQAEIEKFYVCRAQHL
jgi:hypothetical protein